MVKNIGKTWRTQFAKESSSFTSITGRKAHGRLEVDNMVLRPKTGSAAAGVTSWSNSVEMASLFANTASSAPGPSLGYTVVCCASIEDNLNQFIDSAAGLYHLPKIIEFAKEQEVLGIGSITISHIIWA